MTEFFKALRPVKRRLRRNRFLQGLPAGLACGCAAALGLLAVSVFVPIQQKWLFAGALAAGGPVLAALANALRPVRNLTAARAADACGLQERSVTALEMAERPETGEPAEKLIAAQRQDACEHLRTLDVRKIRPKISKRPLAAAAGLLALCAATLLIPSRGDRIAAERKLLSEKTAAMAEQIDEAAAKDEGSLSEKEKAELRKLTEELKRNLAASRDEVDALVALEKAETQLQKADHPDRTAGEALEAMDAMNTLAQAMQAAGMDPGPAENMASAMASGDAAAMSAALSEMSAEQLREMAENLSGDAKQTAEQLAKAAEAGELSEAQLQAMQAAQNGSTSSISASALQQALSGMKAALGGSGSSESNGSGGTGGGNGQKGAGGGAGSGTTNEEQKGGGSSQSSGTMKGNRPPEYKEAEFESIYDPEKAETAVRDVTTEQHSLGSDSVQIETGPGKGSLEGSVPFREVIGEYREQEAQAAESAHLTREQQEWVDEYFRRLTEE